MKILLIAVVFLNSNLLFSQANNKIRVKDIFIDEHYYNFKKNIVHLILYDTVGKRERGPAVIRTYRDTKLIYQYVFSNEIKNYMDSLVNRMIVDSILFPRTDRRTVYNSLGLCRSESNILYLFKREDEVLVLEKLHFIDSQLMTLVRKKGKLKEKSIRKRSMIIDLAPKIESENTMDTAQ